MQHCSKAGSVFHLSSTAGAVYSVLLVRSVGVSRILVLTDLIEVFIRTIRCVRGYLKDAFGEEVY